MASFLEKVLAQKRREVEMKKKLLSFSELFQRVNGLSSFSLFSRSILPGNAIIAEIKRASPSKGILFSGDRIEKLAKIYEAFGASSVSLVTEERYFQGNLKDLQKLKNCIQIPVLRKDFIIDEYQILESKQSGADAVLLITSLLSSEELSKFLDLVDDLRMEAIVEVHTRDEIKKALDADAKIIGINNRNLRTLEVDINTSKSLLSLIPDSRIKIVESGIKDEKDLIFYDKFKVNAFLIGEALVTASNPGEKLKRFCSVLRKK
jgi:indole-3-glycerol phosphate synthase